MATVASVVPVFLLGGLSVFMIRELHISPAGLGGLVAIYFAVCAVASLPAGRCAERYGAAPVTRSGIVLAAACMAGIALLAHSYAVVVAFLVVGGIGNAFGQLGSNLSLAESVPARRQGLSYGVKQAAIPTSTLIAGIAVPALGLTVGWRWAFGVCALLALAALLVVPKGKARAKGGAGERDAKLAALVVVAVGACLAAGTANALGTFLVGSAVDHGVTEAAAGLVLALGSVFGIAGRLTSGWVADRKPAGHLRIVVVMLAIGAIGLALLAAPGQITLVVGTIFGFGLGWAWPGVVNFAVVRLNPSAPAAATSITQAGVYAGGCVGPLSFGTLVQLTSYPTAWAASAVLMAVAAGLMYLGTRMLASGEKSLAGTVLPAPR
nr:MFS transporter [Fodinicola acaciae]